MPSPLATRKRRSTSHRSGRGSSYWALSWRWARSLGLAIASRVSSSPRSASSSSYGASSPIRKRCPGLNALVPCLGAALLIWLGGGEQQTIVGRVLSSAPLVFIGLLSYSIYLWHWPLFVFARYIVMQDLSLPAQVSLVLATFPLSYLSWRYVELPVRRGSYWKGWRIVVTGAAATAASLCLGYAAIATDGLPWRIAPEILALKAHRPEAAARIECHNVTEVRVNAGDLCIRGATDEAPSFVLAGDSHAAAISGGVFAAAARAGLSGYQFTANSFRPLPGVRKKRPSTSSRTGSLNSFENDLRCD